ncbi:MAG: moderate conductance mechanosensitive channel [Patescibacteria group bacterium]|nr:moderate conductance mechanosensitive channel [Patescibacteria group bacterium]
METGINSFFNNSFVRIIIIVLIAILLHYLSSKIIGYLIRFFVQREKSQTLADAKKREDTLIGLGSTLTKIIIWAIAIFAILDVFKFNIASVMAGAGVVGIVVGLGAQTTIRDYLAGIFILLENQYRVGDVITLSGGSVGVGTSGVVEEITLRITKIRDLDGALNVVRNGEANVITNLTFEYSSVVIDVGVDYASDIDNVEKIMNKVGKDMLKDQELAPSIKEPISFLRVSDFTDNSVVVKVIGKVKPAKQWEIAGEYRRRLLKAFNEAGIEIAFPQVVVHQKK